MSQGPNVLKVSVLMPTYNRAEYLKEALNSVLSQTLNSIEIIIVDNSSTDATPEIVASYSDSRIVYIRNDNNIGAVGNYNKALRLAKGEYIYLFSDDDVMDDRENLSEKAAILDKFSNVGVVHSSINTIDKSGVVIGGNWATNTQNWRKLTDTSLLQGDKVFNELYYHWNFINMSTVLLRRDILNLYNIEFNNQLRYLIDWNLWLQISLVSDFFYIDKPFINYRRHTSNETNFLNKDVYFKELAIAKIGLSILFKDNYLVEKNVQKIIKATYLQVSTDHMSKRNKYSFFKKVSSLIGY